MFQNTKHVNFITKNLENQIFNQFDLKDIFTQYEPRNAGQLFVAIADWMVMTSIYSLISELYGALDLTPEKEKKLIKTLHSYSIVLKLNNLNDAVETNYTYLDIQGGLAAFIGDSEALKQLNLSFDLGKYEIKNSYNKKARA